jgi:hypothetical protein
MNWNFKFIYKQWYPEMVKGACRPKRPLHTSKSIFPVYYCNTPFYKYPNSAASFQAYGRSRVHKHSIKIRTKSQLKHCISCNASWWASLWSTACQPMALVDRALWAQAHETVHIYVLHHKYKYSGCNFRRMKYHTGYTHSTSLNKNYFLKCAFLHSVYKYDKVSITDICKNHNEIQIRRFSLEWLFKIWLPEFESIQSCKWIPTFWYSIYR